MSRFKYITGTRSQISTCIISRVRPGKTPVNNETKTAQLIVLFATRPFTSRSNFSISAFVNTCLFFTSNMHAILRHLNKMSPFAVCPCTSSTMASVYRLSVTNIL